MVNILRIELRRSIAPWLALVLVVVAVGFLFLLSGPWWKLPAPWTAQTTTAALWTRFLLDILWPIVVGAGAIQGMRDSRSGMVELLTTSSRPGWHRAVRLAGAVGGLSALGFLLVFLVGFVEVLAHDGFVSPGFLPLVLVSVLVVVAGAWLGLGVGRLLPHPLTAPALAVASLVVTVLLWSALEPDSLLSSVLGSPRIGLLGPAFSQPRGTFVTTAASVDLGQSIWFAGLAATGFLLLVANSVRTRLFGLLPGAVAAVVAVALFPAGDGLVQDTFAAQKLCDGPICVSRLHEDRLAALAGPGREALALLAKLPGAPTRIEEQTAPNSTFEAPARDAGVVYLDFQRNTAQLTANANDLRIAVLAGTGLPACDPPFRGSLADQGARMISAAWFTGELKPLPEFARFYVPKEPGVVGVAWEKFRALPPDVQRERIIAMRQVFLTCQGDPLDTLVPGALK